MKNLFVLIVLFAACFSSQQALAQRQHNVVKINPLSLAVSTFNASYERALSRTKSVQFGVLYTGVNYENVKYSGIVLTPEVRFYLTRREGLNTWYLAPFARYQNLELSADFRDGSTTEATLNGFGVGAMGGYQWLLGRKDRFCIDVFFGPSYSFAELEIESGLNEIPTVASAFEGFGIRTGLGIGLAF